jgi:hypothetical protein
LTSGPPFKHFSRLSTVKISEYTFQINLKEASISFSEMKNKVIDQAGCFENTLPLPQRGKASSVSGIIIRKSGYSVAEIFLFPMAMPDPGGTLPAQPSNGFLNTHPDLFYIRDLDMIP